MLRRVSAAIAAAAVALGGLTFGAAPASAANTAPTAATYGASAAVDVQRTPAYPACTGTTYNTWSVKSTGNPISQSAYNDTGSLTTGRVDLASVSYWDGAATQVTPAVLKVANIAAGPPATFSLKMYIAPAGTTELLWDTATDRWALSAAGGDDSFATTGNAYALYSGGFMHEGVGPGALFEIGTFLMIDGTLPTGNTLVYTPSPDTDAPAANECSSSKTYATAAGMASTTLGGSGTQTSPSSGSSGGGSTPAPTVTLDFDGNGGTCSPSSVTGDLATWGTALTADQCTNGAKQLAFFSTSPTAASGATNVLPGGPVYFLEANRLYAIWRSDPPSAPTNVVATPGLNSVTVSWAPPASDGGDPIRVYNVRYKATTDSNYSTFCNVNAATFQCTAALPATNTQYTFVVSAANQVGRAESVPSSAVSPYDFKDITASRGDVFLGLGGTKVDASGAAPGLAGQALNVQYKIGSAAEWTTVANGVKVNAESRFGWSKKFPASANKKVVTVRFTYGADAVSGTYVLPRGGGAGDLSAPRNIKAKGELNRVSLTWDPPKFDGGAKIIGYTICAQYIGTLCRDVGPAGQGEFRNLLPGAEYSFTVSARTAAKTGPKGKANKSVTFTEASVRVLEREPGVVTTEVKGKGFKDGAKFRVEVAIVPTNGRPRDTWRWDEIREFTADRSFAKAFGTELGSFYDDETIAVRLVTPLGSVFSKASRPPR
jgi:hypothetical protein